MKLGVPPTSYESRDAVHVAYIVATAGEVIAPGAKVRFYVDNKYPFLYDEEESEHLERAHVRNADHDRPDDWDGALDPFLSAPVQPESWCRVLIKPEAISGMRHSFEISTTRRAAGCATEMTTPPDKPLPRTKAELEEMLQVKSLPDLEATVGRWHDLANRYEQGYKTRGVIAVDHQYEQFLEMLKACLVAELRRRQGVV